MDVVLRLCLEEWAAEAYKRGQKLAALFRAGDVDTNGVLSLDEFVAVIRNVRPHGFITEAVRMFREAATLSEERSRKRFHGHSRASHKEAEIDVISFIDVCRQFGLSTVKLDGGRDVPETQCVQTVVLVSLVNHRGDGLLLLLLLLLAHPHVQRPVYIVPAAALYVERVPRCCHEGCRGSCVPGPRSC